MIDIDPQGNLVPTLKEPRCRYNYGTPVIKTALDARETLVGLKDFAAAQQEVFCVLALSGANKPVRIYWPTVGLVDQNQVHPREVFTPAIVARAASIILAHNHPSGSPDPSAEDIMLTKRLKTAGDILGIRVLDHIIITADTTTSLRQLGHL